MIDDIKEFYFHYDEDGRMFRNPLEYIRCKEIISRYLLRDNLRIADIGGATGAFSFWLAEKGHNVSLLDFIPKHIHIAEKNEKEKGIKLSSIMIGDARELPYQDGTFDILLLMGPLYHLIEKHDRIKALKEAYRVLIPNGYIVCEVISSFASMVDGFQYDLINDSDFVDIMFRDIKTGIHKDTSKQRKYFTDSYFHYPDEVSIELEESKFKFEELIALTSFGCMIPNIDDKIRDDNYRDILLRTINLLEKENSLMGISSHYIGIGKKSRIEN